MRYLISKAVLGEVPEIEISGEAYTELSSARKILINAFAIEEKYEIVVCNYLDFERCALDAVTTNMVRTKVTYSNFYEERLGLNIRMVNLLTAVRLYLDQLYHNVPECLADTPNAKESVQGYCSREYDNNKEYRFMEALRNHVQHRSLPIHFIQQNAGWTSMDEKELIEISIQVSSLRSHLAEDEEFKKPVLKELDEKIDLISAARAYVESISNIHESVRELIAQSVANARSTIEGAHREYARVYTQSLTGLHAYMFTDDSHMYSFPLLLDWDNVRIELQRRNTKLSNLRKTYVTGKIKHDEIAILELECRNERGARINVVCNPPKEMIRLQ